MSRKAGATSSGRSGRRRRARLVAGVTLGMVLALAMAACGDDDADDSAASTSPGSGQDANGAKGLRIAFLTATNAAPFPQAEVQNAERIAKEQGAKLEVFDAQFDPQKQASQCQDAMTSNSFDAVIVLPAAGPVLVPCAQQAERAGIPLIAVNSPIGADFTKVEPTVPGVTAQVLRPAKEQEEVVAQAAVNACADQDPCNVGVIIGPRALPFSAMLDAAIKDAAKANPQLKIAGIVEGDFSPDSGTKAAQNLLQKEPALNVLVALSDDMALGAELALSRAGKKPGDDILIIGQGASVAGVKKVRAGAWYGTTPSLAETEARLGFDLAVKAARKQQISNPGIHSNKSAGLPLILDQSNKDKYPDFIGQWGEGNLSETG